MNRNKSIRVAILCLSLAMAGSLPIDAQKVTFHEGSISLKQAFEKLESSSAYKIAYNDSQLDVSRKVSMDQKDMEVLQVLSQLLKNTGYTYKINGNYVIIVPEEVKYPQGAEKMQIKAITNREVKPGGLPSGVGCNVISTQTAYAIYRACYEGMPSIERVLTVAGSAMGDKSYNLQCRFGTPFSYIVEQCGGFVVEPKKIVLGGPMMGLIATNLEAPNIKGTAGILFFTDKEDRSVENPTCIHCGKCLTVCPMKLEPLYMYKYYQNRDFENMQKYHILDCFECGSCSYNCPGRLPLTHTFKTAKLLFAARAAEEKARAEAAAKEAETK